MQEQMMNVPHSQMIASLVGALQNCCYRNAALALLTLPQLMRWYYVEGWVIAQECPIEHGWLLSSKGEIIDPTLALFGREYAPARYFACASFTLDDVRSVYHVEQLRTATHLDPLSSFPRFQWACSVHQAARQLAYARR